MRRFLAGAAVLLLWTGVAGAKEGWKDLAGRSCPPFHVEAWLNTDGARPTPESMVGRVWVLEFLSVG